VGRGQYAERYGALSSLRGNKKLLKYTSNHLLALIKQIQFNSSIDILNVGNLITLIGD
jgi:hypothetical protein